MTYPQKFKERAVRSYLDGKTAQDIGVPMSTLYVWTRQAGVNRSIQEAVHLRVPQLKSGYDIVGTDLAYIVGVLMGDGSLDAVLHNRQRTLGRIQLLTIDREFAEAFAIAIERQFGLRGYITDTLTYPKKTPAYRYSISNIHLHKYLSSVRSLEWVKSLPNALKLAWVRGLWDSEGSVYISGRRKDESPKSVVVDLTNTNIELLGLYAAVLREYQFDFRIRTKTVGRASLKTVYATQISSRNEAIRFCQVVNPTIQRKLERFRSIQPTVPKPA